MVRTDMPVARSKRGLSASTNSSAPLIPSMPPAGRVPLEIGSGRTSSAPKMSYANAYGSIATPESPTLRVGLQADLQKDLDGALGDLARLLEHVADVNR